MLAAFHNDYLYSYVEIQRYMMEPIRQLVQFGHGLMGTKEAINNNQFLRFLSANMELFERLTRHYPKPSFGIVSCEIDGKTVSIEQQTIVKATFCNLLHFKKNTQIELPKLLVVAPMSGHHATLLRGTVEGLLPYFDIYITDWIDAKEIPLDEGNFDFGDFVSYVTVFIKKIGLNTNVLAVCQPSVPVLTAVALMSSDKDPYTPDSLVMMGGPIDSRKSPTEVNDYATERTIFWFETNAITKVPFNYPGAGRNVYPGFLQLYGFMAMNMQNHIDEHWHLFNHLVQGDGENAAKHKKFYNEYLAVMDLPAEFYLDTVNIVFKKHLLPRGELTCNAKFVDTNAITKTAILCIEGEKDDISGRGQTKAALRICRNLADNKKQYLLQKGVGHYGIFNGKKYREEIVPVLKEFIYKHKPKA